MNAERARLAAAAVRDFVVTHKKKSITVGIAIALWFARGMPMPDATFVGNVLKLVDILAPILE